MDNKILPCLSFVKDKFQSPVYQWPSRKFPHSFEVENSKYKAWGLLVDYDQLSTQAFVELLYQNKIRELVNLSSDFLLVVLDKKKKCLKVITGLSGMFPLFFSVEQGRVFISPHFSEVFKSITRPVINEDEILDYLTTEYSIFFTDKTFISQIRRLPPGCLLTIKEDLKFSISEPFSWQEILEIEYNKGLMEPDEFLETFFNTLGLIIQKRLKTVRNLPITCDLSSGFDSSLVAYFLKKFIGDKFKCYSQYTSLNTDDTDPQLVKKFAEKHELQVVLDDIGHITPFGDSSDLEWTKTRFFPGGHYQPCMLFYENEKVIDNGRPLASFTGYGGDEFFHSGDLLNYILNHQKTEFEFTQFIARSGANKILTTKGLNLLVDTARFDNKKLYSNQYGSATVGFLSFPVLWEAGTWFINPYVDTEMVKLSQRMPRVGKRLMHKQELYKDRTEIFLPEQFRVKLPFDEQIKVFYSKSRQNIASILENSVLEKMGLVKARELREIVLSNKSREYIGKMHLMFINLLRLEIFLQANKVIKN